MRAVTAATAAAILELDQKTFDNLLLRLGSAALPSGRQGVERRIPVTLLEDLMLTRDLHQALGIPTREAFAVARRLMGRSDQSGNVAPEAEFVGSLQAGAFVQIGADLRALRDHVQARLEAAVEIVVRRPRGRPGRSSAAMPLGDA
ncbi:MAG TPA: hypothetical protein PLY94_00125 [Gemmatimonadaceae bacterium]|nr:hypothetical protein [Gemmatimonadaceae bacterium]